MKLSDLGLVAALAGAGCADELPESWENPKTCSINLKEELKQHDGDNTIPVTQAYMDAFAAQIVGMTSDSGKGLLVTMDVRPGTEETVWNRAVVGDYSPNLAEALADGAIQPIVTDMDECASLENCDPVKLLPAEMEMSEAMDNTVEVLIALPQQESAQTSTTNLSVVAECKDFITNSNGGPNLVNVTHDTYGTPFSAELERW